MKSMTLWLMVSLIVACEAKGDDFQGWGPGVAVGEGGSAAAEGGGAGEDPEVPPDPAFDDDEIDPLAPPDESP
jgi:hypothetical protein